MENINLILPMENTITSLISSDHLGCLPQIENSYLHHSITNKDKQLCDTEMMDSNVLIALPSSTETNLLPALQNDEVLYEKGVGCSNLESRLGPDVKQQVSLITDNVDFYTKYISIYAHTRSYL